MTIEEAMVRLREHWAASSTSTSTRAAWPPCRTGAARRGRGRPSSAPSPRCTNSQPWRLRSAARSPGRPWRISVKSWELSQAQLEARAKRLDVERLDAAIANMTDVLDEAHQFEGEYTDRLRDIRSKMGAIRGRRYPVGTDSAGYPTSGVPPVALAEYAALERELQQAERERQEQIDNRRVRTVDQAGMPARGRGSASSTSASGWNGCASLGRRRHPPSPSGGQAVDRRSIVRAASKPPTMWATASALASLRAKHASRRRRRDRGQPGRLRRHAGGCAGAGHGGSVKGSDS